MKGDGDFVGFVAYGLYKQNKREWLAAFEREHGRTPNDSEIRSFIVGESLERRLATYRHLAEESLAEQGLAPPRNRLPVPVSSPAPARADAPAAKKLAFSRRDDRDRSKTTGRGSIVALLAYLMVIAIGVAGVAFLLRSGILPLGLGRW